MLRKYAMNNTKNIDVTKKESEIPITTQEYADQYNVSIKTVEQWFKNGKNIITIELDFSELSN